MNIDYLSRLGGLFAVLVFVHFFVDWIFQSHDEAMIKHKNAAVRAKHCLVYTTPFVFLAIILGASWLKLAAIASILFMSHFAEDTYIPVYLWARFIRKPPQLRIDNSQKGFSAWLTEDPVLSKILLIAIDQIIHVSFLVPVAMILMHKQS